MVDADNPEEMAHFAFTKKANLMGHRQLRIKYAGVSVSLAWPDTTEGFDGLDRLASGFEQIMGAARSEMKIRDELVNLDSEIDGLLGGDEQ
jgi:hypothetical protein